MARYCNCCKMVKKSDFIDEYCGRDAVILIECDVKNKDILAGHDFFICGLSIWELLNLNKNNIRKIKEIALDGDRTQDSYCTRWRIYLADIETRLRNHELQNNTYRCGCLTNWFEHWANGNQTEMSKVNVSENECQGSVNCTESFQERKRRTSTALNVFSYVMNFFALPIVCMTVKDHTKKYLKRRRLRKHNKRNSTALSHKEFDAFLCYSRHDRKLVDSIFLPALETHEPPYKACVHYRDFLAGEWITTNIMGSVEKSRCAVILATESFFKSEWCKFEFQAAYSRSLRNSAYRVIVILFPDFHQDPDYLEFNLFQETHTCLAADDHNFWKKFYKALPIPLSKLSDRVNHKPDLALSAS